MKKRFWTKPISLVLVLVISLGMVFGATPVVSAEANPTVSMRYIITSDVHNVTENVTAMLQTAYDYAQTQDYKGLDAVVVAGDMVTDALESEYQDFKATLDAGLAELAEKNCNPQLVLSMGNHETRTVEGRTKTHRQVFEEQLGVAPDADYNVNGYHFITLSSADWAGYYTLEQFNWLDERVAAAQAEDANKPVMLIIHEPMENTVYGTEISGHSQVYSQDKLDIINKYPQLMIWSGHSHSFTNHQRGVWQSEAGWVQLCTGTLQNYSRPWESLNIEPFGEDLDSVKITPIFSIVEVLSDNSTIVKHATIDGHIFDVEWQIGAEYDNTYDGRAEKAVTPQYADGVTFDYQMGSTSVAITLPQTADVENTEYYRIDATSADGETITKYVSSQYWMATPPATLTTTITGLEQNTEYTINLYPVGFYGNSGTPLSATVTTAYTLEAQLDTFISGTVTATDSRGNALWMGDTSYIGENGFANPNTSSSVSLTSVSGYNLGNKFEIAVDYSRPNYNYYDENYAYFQVGSLGVAMRRSPNPNKNGEFTSDAMAVCYGYDISSSDSPFSTQYVIKSADVTHITGSAEYRLTYDNGHIILSRDGVTVVDVSADEFAAFAADADFSNATVAMSIKEKYSQNSTFETLSLFADSSNMDGVSFKYYSKPFNSTDWSLVKGAVSGFSENNRFYLTNSKSADAAKYNNKLDLGESFEVNFTHYRNAINNYEKDYSYLQLGEYGVLITNYDLKDGVTADSYVTICKGYDAYNSSVELVPDEYKLATSDNLGSPSTAHIYKLAYSEGVLSLSRDGAQVVSADISADGANFDNIDVVMKINTGYNAASNDSGVYFADLQIYKQYTVDDVNNLIASLIVNEKLAVSKETVEFADELYNSLATYQLSQVDSAPLEMAKAIVAGIAGDVNSNGVISSNDFLITQMLLLDMARFDSLTEARCDVDFDGAVGSADALCLKQKLLGIVS